MIRLFKRNITKSEKGYRLVVCKECFIKYTSLRRKFERRRALYVAIGVIFTAMFLALSPNKLMALAYGILVIIFLYLLSLVNYIPALEMPHNAEKTASKAVSEAPSEKAPAKSANRQGKSL